MFTQRAIKLLSAFLLTLPLLLISNASIAAEYTDIYSSFTVQNAAVNASWWLMSVTLLLGFCTALLFWSRPKEFISRDEWQKYYDSYRTRVI